MKYVGIKSLGWLIFIILIGYFIRILGMREDGIRILGFVIFIISIVYLIKFLI
jgi:hypothetical protein